MDDTHIDEPSNPQGAARAATAISASALGQVADERMPSLLSALPAVELKGLTRTLERLGRMGRSCEAAAARSTSVAATEFMNVLTGLGRA